MNSYNKPSLSIPEQAQLLLDKGLICNDRERLERYLSTIGYYRLKVYWLPYLSEDNKQCFLPNTTFDQVLGLYIFDRKLRLLVMEALERIEVALRAHWSNELALHGGSHAYMDSNLFKFPQEHKRLLDELKHDIQNSKEKSIIHYTETYDSPSLPPSWTVTEVMSFGTLSRWFKVTQDKAANKKKIIESFGMSTRIDKSFDAFETIIHGLTIVRNTCAHHSGLWNRKFVINLPKKYCATWMGQRFADDSNKNLDKHLYNYLIVIEALLRAISPKTSWTNRLIRLLNTIESTHHKAMAFPDDWREREPWKSNAP
jgi:abortive infection bacteriophage resistance protein